MQIVTDSNHTHELLTAKISIKLKNCEKTSECRHFDVTGDTTEYNTEVSNKFKSLLSGEGDKTLDCIWVEEKPVLRETANKYLLQQGKQIGLSRV